MGYQATKSVLTNHKKCFMQVLNDSRLMVGIPIWEPCPDVTIRFWWGTAQMILLDVTCAHTHILSFHGGCQVHHSFANHSCCVSVGSMKEYTGKNDPIEAKASSCQSEVPLWNLQELRVNCSKQTCYWTNAHRTSCTHYHLWYKPMF
jgi:hypothetical protein